VKLLAQPSELKTTAVQYVRRGRIPACRSCHQSTVDVVAINLMPLLVHRDYSYLAQSVCALDHYISDDRHVYQRFTESLNESETADS